MYGIVGILIFQNRIMTFASYSMTMEIKSLYQIQQISLYVIKICVLCIGTGTCMIFDNLASVHNLIL